jgi:hypothetical protein
MSCYLLAGPKTSPLNDLLRTLGAGAFLSTQRNNARVEGNTDPRKKNRQQAAVELSLEDLSLLSDSLRAAFDTHGTDPEAALEGLDWPISPDATGRPKGNANG